MTTVNDFTNKEVMFTFFFALIFVFEQLSLKCLRGNRVQKNPDQKSKVCGWRREEDGSKFNSGS